MTDINKGTFQNRLINAEKSLCRNIIAVLFGILSPLIVSIPIDFIDRRHIDLERYANVSLMAEVRFEKLQNQLLVGLGCMLMTIIMITIFTLTIGNTSFTDLPDYLKTFEWFVIFTPASILVAHLISKYYLKKRSEVIRKT